MRIVLNGVSINDFCVTKADFTQAVTAEKYLREYVKKLTGKDLSGNKGEVRFIFTDGNDDAFTLSLEKNVLTFEGGKRGVIYAVFELLEKCGCRFFTPAIETLPTADIELTDFSDSQCSPFLFRDVLSLYTTDKEWSLKNRLDSCLWGKRGFSESEGGGWRFAGIPAHSLTGEFLLKPYINSNPEYFSLVDGKRLTDRNGQVCMTNADAVDAVVVEIDKLLAQNPECNIVSVSEGDNKNFCTCDKCAEKVAKVGLTRAYYDFINAVAYKVYERHPKVLIHTFAYMSLCELNGEFELAPNIMVQYCIGGCGVHEIGGCEYNASQVDNLRLWTKMCGNVFIWDYINCFKHELMDLPTLYNYLPNLRTFEKFGVKGVFNEGAHDTDWDRECGFIGMPELRGYVMSKAMWNPSMTDKQYNKHIEEFCAAFYGEGGKAVTEYIKLLYDCSRGSHASYDCFTLDGSKSVARLIDEDKTDEFTAKAYALINNAVNSAKGEYKARLEKVLMNIVYYDLFRNMENVLARGSEEEKQEALRKNEWLVGKMREFDVRPTFWGDTSKNQIANVDATVPPSKWNYKW